jgi:hypothetical protein
MAVTYLAAAIFVPIIDYWSYTTLGLVLLPNLYWALMLFVITPLACVMSVEANVIVSSKVSDIRAAQQLGGIVVLPLIFVVLIGSVISTSLMLALGVTTALIVADVALFYLSKATFQREEILTKWK